MVEVDDYYLKMLSCYDLENLKSAWHFWKGCTASELIGDKARWYCRYIQNLIYGRFGAGVPVTVEIPQEIMEKIRNVS
jgi:hypothetical protein